MKKIITKAVCLLCAGALVLGAAGCSKSADSSSAASSTAAAVYGSAEDYDYENFSYSSGLDENGYWEGVKALDYVTLPENFASLTFKRSEIEPTEEEIQSEIDSLLSDHATEKQVTDRAAADGDTVNIDYAGSVDGVAFSGGTYSGYSLTLGSGTFVDGFEDQIVGHTPGETFDVTVTFPEGYSDSTDSEGNTVVLSGKKAVFSVTLNYISEKVLPELTDAWVAENYGESDDVHTVEELKALYQKMLYNTNLQNAIMDDLLANSTFKELPKEVTDYQVNQCLNYYYTMANYYGYDLDSFVQPFRPGPQHHSPPYEQAGECGACYLPGGGKPYLLHHGPGAPLLFAEPAAAAADRRRGYGAAGKIKPAGMPPAQGLPRRRHFFLQGKHMAAPVGAAMCLPAPLFLFALPALEGLVDEDDVLSEPLDAVPGNVIILAPAEQTEEPAGAKDDQGLDGPLRDAELQVSHAAQTAAVADVDDLLAAQL